GLGRRGQVSGEGERARADRCHGVGPRTLAGVLVRAGARERAELLARETGETPRPLIGRVLYHLLASQLDEAAAWYERAINCPDPFALVFASGPLNQELRQSSHWPRLARMMNLPVG